LILREARITATERRAIAPFGFISALSRYTHLRPSGDFEGSLFLSLSLPRYGLLNFLLVIVLSIDRGRARNNA